jgi:hypothetical protein
MANDHRDLDEVSIGVALLKAAMVLVNDRAKAHLLVELTFEAARLQEEREVPLTEADLFRLLRQTYHSVERSPARRRSRDSLATSIAARQRRARETRAG